IQKSAVQLLTLEVYEFKRLLINSDLFAHKTAVMFETSEMNSCKRLHIKSFSLGFPASTRNEPAF
ncbi:MAG TPA: hypothetical protein VN369_02990, partial [Terriglobales bacterium]|nr:hypothetical protein [Terriglobales bacterium]